MDHYDIANNYNLRAESLSQQPLISYYWCLRAKQLNPGSPYENSNWFSPELSELLRALTVFQI